MRRRVADRPDSDPSQELRRYLVRAGGFEGRLRRVLAALLAAVVLGGGGFVSVGPAAANGTVEVTVQDPLLRKRLFMNHMRARMDGASGFKDLMLSASMVGYRQQNPGATYQQLLQHVTVLRQHYTESLTDADLERPAYQFAIKLLELTALAPGGAVASPLMKELLESTVGTQLRNYGSMVDQITAAQFQHSWFLQQYTAQDEVWQYVHNIALVDPTFKNAWNAAFGVRYNVDAAALTDTLAADPHMANWMNIGAILDNQQNQTLYLREAMAQLKKLLGDVNGEVADYNEALRFLAARFPLSNDGPKPDAAAHQAAVQQAAAAQEWISGAASAVQILSTLVGFADKRAGEVVAGVGGAAVQIASAINQYLPTIAAKGLAQALTSMSTLALTGNVLGAISALLPVFAGGATPEQQILEELAALRGQVVKFEQNMHSRFDRIETSLTTIYADMMTQFETVIQLQNATNAQLRQINTQLARITERIDLWGNAIFTNQREDKINETKELINSHVGYTARSGIEMDYQRDYLPVSNALQFDITDEAKATVFTAPLTETDPNTALDMKGVYGSIGYLHKYARDNLGLTAPNVDRPADVEAWLLGATGYQMLLAQNPQHAARVDGQAEAVIESGEDIQNAVRTLSKPRKPTGDNPRYLNNFIYDVVMAYRWTAFHMAQRMAVIRDEIRQGREHDMFGSPTQAVPTGQKPTADPATVPSCSGHSAALTRPTQVKYADLPQELWVAQYGKPDAAITLCHESGWINQLTRHMGGWEVTTADLEFKFVVRQRWDGGTRTVREWSKVFPQGVVCRVHETLPGSECRFADQELARWNSTYRSQFEQSATSVDNTAEAQQRSRNWFRGQAAAYYTRVTGELTNPNPSNPAVQTLHSLNKQLTSESRLMRAYLKLGFGTALAQDDVLALNVLGTERFPSDLDGRNMITASFEKARANYCADQKSPCTLKQEIEGPKAGQTMIDCHNPVNTDPIAYCAEWLTYYRTDEMYKRLDFWSKKLDDNEYVEGLPAVDLVIRSIDTANRIAKQMSAP
ncbi:hypothetical protein ABT336_08350 [Micromonospora sp. NPDC000207]|uniref:hypothetical protein n=1 Tax=Micromonospora sp. NPDC000207 TaxID=3154246 RepID=UPI00331CA671